MKEQLKNQLEKLLIISKNLWHEEMTIKEMELFNELSKSIIELSKMLKVLKETEGAYLEFV